jgi:predicted transcriptional regulator of viral defense system
MNTQSARTDPRDLRRRLADVAGAQAGYFTAADAVAVGYSHQAQKFHVDSGNWMRVGRGIFRLPSWPVGEHDDLVRWALWARGRAVVSHETALRVHDLGDVNPTLIHVTVPSGFRQSAAAVRLHRGVLPPADVVGHAGYRVTTPTRSLVDVAGADLPQDQLVIAVRDAIHRGVTTRHRLIDRAETLNDRATLRIERALGEIEATP